MGTWVDPDQERVTFGEFSTQWRLGKNSVSGKTLATYDSQLRLHVLPYFRNLTLTGITTADVRSWVSKLNSERTGATTIRQSYRLFRQIMESAYLDERISRNPCAGIQLPKITTADKRGLTREELNALANACGDYSALIMFLGTTVLRIGEALPRSRYRPRTSNSTCSTFLDYRCPRGQDTRQNQDRHSSQGSHLP